MCKRRETQLEGGRVLEACRKAPPVLRMGFPGSCGRVRPVESLGRWFLMVVAKGGRTAQTLAAPELWCGAFRTVESPWSARTTKLGLAGSERISCFGWFAQAGWLTMAPAGPLFGDVLQGQNSGPSTRIWRAPSKHPSSSVKLLLSGRNLISGL